MNRRTSLVLMFVGMSVLISGFYLAFFWMKLQKGYYDVEGGAVLQLSWYLEEGDRTEGGFTVSGGNEEVRFYIENPSGVIIYDAGIVKTRLSTGFTAGYSGIYSLYFENLEPLSDKVIHVRFRSPYEPRRFTPFEILGLPMMFGGTAILIYGVIGVVRALRGSKDLTESVQLIVLRRARL
ncbi:hypothetical protein IBX38_09560 [Candidatus Bathyarchaeota archaeon]|nr:hypothetical protein [Candidatus Bathyarchaeota archaeon]